MAGCCTGYQQFTSVFLLQTGWPGKVRHGCWLRIKVRIAELRQGLEQVPRKVFYVQSPAAPGSAHKIPRSTAESPAAGAP